jgi:hypothetical protein
MLKDSEITLKFQLDLPVYVEGIGNFKPLNIKKIAEIGEEKYNTLLSSLMFSKENLQSDEGLEEVTDIQVLYMFVNHDEQFRSTFFEAIETHFDSKPLLHEEGFIYFGQLDETTILEDSKMEYIQRLIRLSNFLKEQEKDEYEAGNERAKKFMEKLRKKKEKLANVKKDQITLQSMISAVGWKSNSFFDVHKLNIYQLNDAFHRLGTIDNYHYTLTGIYSGAVDGSKIKLPDINWANNIKLN